MTEIPEHLLARSRARRAAAGLGGDEAAASSVPATSESSEPAAAAPVPAAAAAPPAPPEPPEPDLPWVEANKGRRKIPAFAQVMLLALPVWALVFALTNDEPTNAEPTPLEAGATEYAKCSSCHGASGGGGSGPALSDGAVLQTFPTVVEQAKWVYLGSDGWKQQIGSTYGATNKPIAAGGMPAWDTLTGAQLMEVILHERTTLSGEEFDIEAYKELADEPVLADKKAEIEATLAEWEATPPVQ